jgi:hypothetical protein
VEPNRKCNALFKEGTILDLVIIIFIFGEHNADTSLTTRIKMIPLKARKVLYIKLFFFCPEGLGSLAYAHSELINSET